MKKIIIIVLTSFIYIVGICQPKKIQNSIGLGDAPNRIKLYLKTDSTLVNHLIGTLQWDIAIPDNVLPRPNLTIKSFNVGNGWAVTPQLVPEEGFWHYVISTQSANYPFSVNANQEFEAMQLEFTDGPPNPSDVYSMTLGVTGGIPNIPGGLLFQSLFNLDYDIMTPLPMTTRDGDLYYIRPGTQILNNLSYSTPAMSWARISNVLLPVKFKDFNAVKEGGTAKLTWTVEGETATTDRYEVQSSSNCSDFTTITTVPANVKPNGSNSYTLSNVKLNSTNTTCYRIKQVDKDGRFAISVTRAINLSGKSGVVSVYPNPAVDVVKVTVDELKATSVNISVSGANGQNVLNQKFSAVAGVNVFPINLSKLASGNYNFKITTGTKTEIIPVVKK
jgi:hypothetical protein